MNRNQENHLYGVIKSWRIRWSVRVVYMNEIKNAYNIFYENFNEIDFLKT
jgi:hypothetical protein